MTFPTLLYNVLLLATLVGALLRARRRAPEARLAPARQGLILLCAVATLGAIVPSLEGFVRFQLLGWAAFLYGPVYLVAAGILLRRRRRLAFGAFAVAVLAWGIALVAFVIEPRWLEVTHIEIPTDKIDAPLTIAVLADIQTDHAGDWEREVLAQVVSEAPDLVIFAGDYVQHPDPDEHERIVTRLNRILREAGLNPPLGMVAVRGNIDPGGWQRIFEGTGAVVSDSRQVLDLGPVTVTMLSLSESFAGTKIDPAEDFHIVVGHAPDFALGAPPADLMVAGHTHGGQVRLPLLGPVYTLSRVSRDWAAGVTEVRPGSTLVVSRGIGMEREYAPRVRFLCRPELIIITLVPAG
ncbi:MAG: metallophosphoesterase [Pseudomonadota bacterium]